jgi:hypothetical protein
MSCLQPVSAFNGKGGEGLIVLNVCDEEVCSGCITEIRDVARGGRESQGGESRVQPFRFIIRRTAVAKAPSLTKWIMTPFPLGRALVR